MFVDRVRLDAPVEGYAATLPIVGHLAATPLEFRTPITVFTGDNGSGKSTLVEAIAVARGANPEGGSRHANFTTTDSVSRLWQAFSSPFPRSSPSFVAQSRCNKAPPATWSLF